MKLELKHLSPYLPYKLRGVFLHTDNTIEYVKITMASSNGIGYDDEEFYKNVGDKNYYELTKPILRPLSDLKLSEWKSKVFKLQNKYNDSTLLFCDFDRKELSVWEYDFLLRNHFDVFGLIEKGLAIDINTIK